ncbi:hypothetical protein [Actinacidiphila glaucinigra]|uniref:hypothetical protein n=1 Tax=Actinacidiphila glaucinigra TaxID=235986 RepID=UPI0036E19AD2
MNGVDLMQWATPAAQALLAAMTSDLWASARDRFAAVLARRSGHTAEMADELDESRQELLGDPGNEDLRSGVETEWARRLRRVLTQDPETLEEIRHLITEFGASDDQSATIVNQHIAVRDKGISFNQGSGVQHNRASRD